MTQPVKPCGTRAAYARGCRCRACTDAASRYHHDRRIEEPLPTDAVENLPAIPPPGPWIHRAACAGLPADWFFPTRGQGSVVLIQAVCDSCPVRADCLAWAVENRIHHGFWGGTSERERRRIRKAMVAT